MAYIRSNRTASYWRQTYRLPLIRLQTRNGRDNHQFIISVVWRFETQIFQRKFCILQSERLPRSKYHAYFDLDESYSFLDHCKALKSFGTLPFIGFVYQFSVCTLHFFQISREFFKFFKSKPAVFIVVTWYMVVVPVEDSKVVQLCSKISVLLGSWS